MFKLFQLNVVIDVIIMIGLLAFCTPAAFAGAYGPTVWMEPPVTPACLEIAHYRENSCFSAQRDGSGQAVSGPRDRVNERQADEDKVDKDERGHPKNNMPDATCNVCEEYETRTEFFRERYESGYRSPKADSYVPSGDRRSYHAGMREGCR